MPQQPEPYRNQKDNLYNTDSLSSLYRYSTFSYRSDNTSSSHFMTQQLQQKPKIIFTKSTITIVQFHHHHLIHILLSILILMLIKIHLFTALDFMINAHLNTFIGLTLMKI